MKSLNFMFLMFFLLIGACQKTKFDGYEDATQVSTESQNPTGQTGSPNDMSNVFNDPNKPFKNPGSIFPNNSGSGGGSQPSIGGYNSDPSTSSGSTSGGSTSGSVGETSSGTTSGTSTGSTGSVGGQTSGSTSGGSTASSGPNWLYWMDGKVPVGCDVAQHPIYFNLVQTTSTGRRFSKTFDMNQIAVQFPRLLYISIALDGARTNTGFWQVSLRFLGREYSTAANDPNRPGDDLIGRLTKTSFEAFTSFPGPLVKFAHDALSLPGVFAMEAFLPPANRVTLQAPVAYLYHCK